jgi:hypothetical protein
MAKSFLVEDREKSIIDKEKGENYLLKESEFWDQAENVKTY